MNTILKFRRSVPGATAGRTTLLLACMFSITTFADVKVHAGTLSGPVVPYSSFTASSPFYPNTLISGYYSYFYLDTWEGAQASSVNGTGFTASGFQLQVTGPGPDVDSVEGVNNGHSLYAGDSAGITFTFDKAALGGHLPTDVGIAWTDGGGPSRTFQAFDAIGNPLSGSPLTDSTGVFFPASDSDPSNYRLFYATNPGGISSIVIANSTGGIEVDDLQYGYAVPEPAALALLAVGLLMVIGPRVLVGRVALAMTRAAEASQPLT